ncbi:hypothetical protein Xgly_09260 [Xanthomonas citri pv. glycines]|uniref:Uncharacterized protein n=1 Tax=Xanthomonas campestris pv. glycines TaxID=473421 RepID=A0AAX0HXN8_XANCG|nr:hypothetical protein BIY41_19265 [Xanthomonas citri pv. glycines]OOX04563.1 hypothetical protein Xgly_09260 [Xanthomonas citri pv. glycines]
MPVLPGSLLFLHQLSINDPFADTFNIEFLMREYVTISMLDDDADDLLCRSDIKPISPNRRSHASTPMK